MFPALVLASILAAAPTADCWPGFRGDGTSVTAARDLPLEWSPKSNLAWKTPTAGYGQSAPVVWKGNVYLTSVEGEQKESLHVASYDLKTGEKRWQKTFPASQKGKNNPMMSRAAATPVVDAGGVYALFESGDLIALDHSGKLRWDHSFVKDFGELKNNHGLGSSPAQTDDTVVVLLDHQGPSHLLAIDKSSGKTRWDAERPARSSWTSPVVATIGGTEQILVSSGGSVAAYAVEKGKKLWEKTDFVGNSIPSATFAGSRLVIAAGENRMKPDADATSKSNCCLELTGGEKPSGELKWSAKKLAVGTSSPLIHAGHVYFVDKSGTVVCVNLETGAEKYRERLDNQQWATPIGCGDRVYFFGKDGTTPCIRASRRDTLPDMRKRLP